MSILATRHAPAAAERPPEDEAGLVMQQLQDRIAVVTRASRGIGAAMFVLIRPRTHRFLEVAFRPVIETPWG